MLELLFELEVLVRSIIDRTAFLSFRLHEAVYVAMMFRRRGFSRVTILNPARGRLSKEIDFYVPLRA